MWHWPGEPSGQSSWSRHHFLDSNSHSSDLRSFLIHLRLSLLSLSSSLSKVIDFLVVFSLIVVFLVVPGFFSFFVSLGFFVVVVEAVAVEAKNKIEG